VRKFTEVLRGLLSLGFVVAAQGLRQIVGVSLVLGVNHLGLYGAFFPFFFALLVRPHRNSPHNFAFLVALVARAVVAHNQTGPVKVGKEAIDGIAEGHQINLAIVPRFIARVVVAIVLEMDVES